MTDETPSPAAPAAAVLVAAGIFWPAGSPASSGSACSRTTSASSDAADAFTAGFRIPNFLQNLFGEGALSASFIPVYASLLARGEPREADRVAGAVGSLLALVVSVIVLVGVLATPLFIAVIAPGFHRRQARSDDRDRPRAVSRRRACSCCRPGVWAC